MAEDGDDWQVFITSLLTNSKEANQSEVVLSAEDSAWVDSCMVSDPELSDDKWSDFKDALLDIATLQQTSNYNSSAFETEGIPKGVNDDHVPMNEDGGASEFPESFNLDFLSASGKREFLGARDINPSPRGVFAESEEARGPSEIPERVNSDLVSANEDAETAEIAEFLGLPKDFFLHIGKNSGSPNFNPNLKRGFLSNYDDLEENEDSDVGEENNDKEIEKKSSSENIFKVWDFDTWTEEDELFMDLKKAIAGSSIEDAAAPTLDNFFSQSGKEKIDDLISGIDNLSLRPPS